MFFSYVYIDFYKYRTGVSCLVCESQPKTGLLTDPTSFYHNNHNYQPTVMFIIMYWNMKVNLYIKILLV